MRRLLALCVVLIASTSLAAPPEGGPRLTFQDIRYLKRSLDDFASARTYVLVFTMTSCPVANRYWPPLNRLEQAYRSKGVQFIAVNVGADDSITAIAAHAVEHEVAFPCVKDVDGTCAAALGVTRTPQVVVLDAGRKVRYRGRIDDQYRVGGARPQPTREDLREALEAVLAGRDVAVPVTEVDGCPITKAELPRPEREPTYAEDVAPILRKHCVECHRPGTAAPFTLLTYEETAGKARAIAEVVADGRMPPWYAAPDHGTFINRRGLTAKERETVLQWAKLGRSRGDDARLPRVSETPAGWRIGTPSRVMRGPEHELPADGVVGYKYVVLPYPFLADTWVQGVEIRADNPRVLHHCNLAYLKLGDGFRMNNFVTGTVPGGDAMTLEPGVGFKIPAGALLVMQIHYVTTGKPERCRISVGLKYASGPIDRQLRFSYLVTQKYEIPPGEPAYRLATSRTLSADAIGVALVAHMHLRGRDMTFKAHYPDGTSEVLLVIPNYNFDWQMAYRWPTGAKRFPRGTRLEAIAHYDNSAFNPFNPDPKATVRDGLQTTDEMLNGFVFYVEAGEQLGLEIDGKSGHVLAK
jgi:hypothetical protein